MEKYSETEIARIINDCEILILPDDSNIEEFLKDENQQSLSANRTTNVVPNPVTEGEETDEDFERFYQQSFLKKQNVTIPAPEDFSYLNEPIQSSSREAKPNPERVLTINRMLKERLVNFRTDVVSLIERVDAEYHKNNKFLEQVKSGDSKDTKIIRSSYTKCGAPFFKDAHGCPAPFNEDFKYRKHILREFFPFDLPETNSRWKTKEKVALISGVKSQMISYIKSQQSQKLCHDSRKTRSNLMKMKFVAKNTDLEESSMMEIYQSIQKNFPNFKINWNLISFSDLQSMHSVAECMGMWISYLRPDLNREPFTKEENEVIAQIIADGTFDDWNDISEKLDRRSTLQSFVHFHASFSKICAVNVRWSEDEDKKLLKAVEKYSVSGNINWNRIGQIIPKRNKTQCYNRWQIIEKYPTQKKGIFSREENITIMKFVEQYGENGLAKIPADLLPGRCSSQIRTHYNIALKVKGDFKPWTKEEDKRLMEFVKQNGPDWREFSNNIKTHNRLSCRTRYLTISKFLTKHPDKSILDVPSKTKKKTSVQKASCSDIVVVEEPKISPSNVLLKFKQDHPGMYQNFKTTFNYDLSARDIIVDFKKLKVLIQLFDVEVDEVTKKRSFEFTSSQLKTFEQVQQVTLNTSLLSEMIFAKAHTQFLMPPNLNTITGLRAITIKLNTEPLDENDIQVIAYPSTEYKKNRNDFQKLYFSLFYWSLMLSKVDIGDLNEISFTNFPKYTISAKDIVQQLNKGRSLVRSSNGSKRRMEGEDAGPSAKK